MWKRKELKGEKAVKTNFKEASFKYKRTKLQPSFSKTEEENKRVRKPSTVHINRIKYKNHSYSPIHTKEWESGSKVKQGNKLVRNGKLAKYEWLIEKYLRCFGGDFNYFIIETGENYNIDRSNERFKVDELIHSTNKENSQKCIHNFKGKSTVLIQYLARKYINLEQRLGILVTNSNKKLNISHKIRKRSHPNQDILQEIPKIWIKKEGNFK